MRPRLDEDNELLAAQPPESAQHFEARRSRGPQVLNDWTSTRLGPPPHPEGRPNGSNGSGPSTVYRCVLGAALFKGARAKLTKILASITSGPPPIGAGPTHMRADMDIESPGRRQRKTRRGDTTHTTQAGRTAGSQASVGDLAHAMLEMCLGVCASSACNRAFGCAMSTPTSADTACDEAACTLSRGAAGIVLLQADPQTPRARRRRRDMAVGADAHNPPNQIAADVGCARSPVGRKSRGPIRTSKQPKTWRVHPCWVS